MIMSRAFVHGTVLMCMRLPRFSLQSLVGKLLTENIFYLLIDFSLSNFLRFFALVLVACDLFEVWQANRRQDCNNCRKSERISFSNFRDADLRIANSIDLVERYCLWI